MLPRLEAERALRLHHLMVASHERMLPDKPHVEYMAELQRQAQGDTHLRRPESEGDLAKLGIRVRTEPKAE